MVARSAPTWSPRSTGRRTNTGRWWTSYERRTSDYADLVAPEIPDLEQIADRLAADDIFVEYLVGKTSTVAVVITSAASDVLTLDIGREQLADLVFFARGAIERERTGSDADLSGGAPEAAIRRAHRPIENDGWLDGKTRLVIAPHAELHYLPFQALVTDRNSVEFLVQELAIAYAPSASVWLRLSDRSRSGNGKELLAGSKIRRPARL